MKIHNRASSSRIKDQLYLLSKSIYPQLTDNLVLTGCHSLLVEHIPVDRVEQTKELLGCIMVTEGMYRLPACLENCAVVYPCVGDFTVWHVCLEHDLPDHNYGIFVNGGLLVESCCISHFDNRLK